VALAAATVAPRGAGAAVRHGHVLVLDGNSYSTNVDLDHLLRIRKGRSGDFLWFVRGGQAYVVTDAAVLAAGRDALRPVHALSREQEALRVRLRPFEEREEALDDEEERLEERSERLEGRDDRAANEERERLEPLQRELDSKQRALRADLREIEAEERQLEDRERAIEAVADAQIERLIDDALRRGLAQRVR
jgi:bla regulator protein blaR1